MEYTSFSISAKCVWGWVEFNKTQYHTFIALTLGDKLIQKYPRCDANTLYENSKVKMRLTARAGCFFVYFDFLSS